MAIVGNIKKNDDFAQRTGKVLEQNKLNEFVWKPNLTGQDRSPVPRFEIDEVFEIRGYLFRVSHIGKRKMILRPMRPA